jgi:hypothetical protein
LCCDLLILRQDRLRYPAYRTRPTQRGCNIKKKQRWDRIQKIIILVKSIQSGISGEFSLRRCERLSRDNKNKGLPSRLLLILGMNSILTEAEGSTKQRTGIL